uniref:Uncharacterized protein n=1 Tax=Oncorhynchus tshawytscha TaxID=74940 RepID=A0A8C8LS15_ONCTS
MDNFLMYSGLDIITNKLMAEERALCSHGMISLMDPLVSSFRNKALNVYRREKLPSMVGGTTYFKESLLWRLLMDTVKNTELRTTLLTPYSPFLTPHSPPHSPIYSLLTS